MTAVALLSLLLLAVALLASRRALARGAGVLPWTDAEAAQLGLRVLGTRLVGERRGFAVDVSARVDTSRATPRPYTLVRAELEPALDLGFALYPVAHGAIAWGGDDLHTGYTGLDVRYDVRGDEPGRVQRLLHAAPRLVELLAHPPRGLAFTVTDAAVVASVDWDVRVPARLAWLVDHVAEVAELFVAASGRTPAAAALEPWVLSWSHHAARQGLALRHTPLCLRTQVGDRDVWLYAVRRGARDYGFELRVAFPAPLDLGLWMYPAAYADRLALLRSGDDVELGDPRFDRAFVVCCADAAAVRDIFSPELLQRVHLLHDRVACISLDDRGIAARVHLSPAHPHVAFRLVEELGSLAADIAARARPRSTTPYR